MKGVNFEELKYKAFELILKFHVHSYIVSMPLVRNCTVTIH